MAEPFIRYTVKIIGDRPPFRWEVFQQNKRIEVGRRNTASGAEIEWLEGQADTREKAVGAAYRAAQEVERDRVYEAMVLEEVLFDVTAAQPSQPVPLTEECPEYIPIESD